ncbi:MAG: 4-hydroxythreonine-4-phosphate dehydrogenase PdxA [Sphingomonas sanxanigenens]|uniref:4-hydroxythreonine-4-phosphate dehydrogenase n=1 Tax=Sphingomonas sanxanigenens TaxID=397260 RepID=A0A2W5ABY8_9SPHN|nr:MAG: 4-hydroxythreonine-4-phosphate dehydrogenase PdxA [Sphingomonas sanxanigenens]
MIPLDPLVVALGDPAGIGPEVTAKAWMACRDLEDCPPFLAVGDARSIEAVWSGPVARIYDPSEAARIFPTALPIIQVEDAGDIRPGHADFEGARCSLDSLELAVGLARSGAVSGLVTGPVSKSQLYAVGFTHPGQTEFVAERCGIARENVVMMLAGPGLKVVPITTHMPLADVPKALTVDLIVSRSIVTARGLQRNFGIERPHLAFAGFNPHAGEDGKLGHEEIDIVGPAMEILRAEGIHVTGPYAADTMFHPRARELYDVAMCLYHDQALIPIKTLYFDDGVNISLGLPIVRTSPDHGTAFNIAGHDLAHPGAMIAAIRMAAAAARMRLERALA